MKKLSLYILASLAISFTACDITELEEQLMQIESEAATRDILPAIETRTSNDLNVFSSGAANIPSYLSQITEMPLKIHLPDVVYTGGRFYSFLRGKTSGSVELNDVAEPGASNTIWILEKPATMMGLNEYALRNERNRKYLSYQANSPSKPIMVDELPTNNLLFPSIRGVHIKPDNDNERFYIFNNDPDRMILSGAPLGPESTSGKSLIFSEDYDYLRKWSFTPMESFELEKIEFDYVPGKDSYELVQITTQDVELRNDSEASIRRTYDFIETKTYESHFTSTSKYSLTSNESSTYKTTAPEMGTNLDLSSSQSYSQEVTYQLGEKETTTKTQQVFTEITIPPHFSGRLYMADYRYIAKLTSVLTYKGLTTGKRVKVLGRWEGYEQSSSKLFVEQYNTGEVMTLDAFMESQTSYTLSPGPEITVENNSFVNFILESAEREVTGPVSWAYHTSCSEMEIIESGFANNGIKMTFSHPLDHDVEVQVLATYQGQVYSTQVTVKALKNKITWHKSQKLAGEWYYIDAYFTTEYPVTQETEVVVTTRVVTDYDEIEHTASFFIRKNMTQSGNASIGLYPKYQEIQTAGVFNNIPSRSDEFLIEPMMYFTVPTYEFEWGLAPGENTISEEDLTTLLFEHLENWDGK